MGRKLYVSAEAGTDMAKAFPRESGTEKAVYISFSTPYARRQHEELDYVTHVAARRNILKIHSGGIKAK